MPRSSRAARLRVAVAPPRVIRVAAVPLPAHQVLVTIGTPCTLSAVGTTETAVAHLLGSDDEPALAAFDAGIVDLAVDGDGSLSATSPDGAPLAIADIAHDHAEALRADRGIRVVPELFEREAPVDIAAPLPHDLGRGGVRRLAGLGYRDVRGCDLRDMHGLFDDDPRLGPSLQAQLFVYVGIGALAALPRPLAEIVEHPADFRVTAAAAFPGVDAWVSS